MSEIIVSDGYRKAVALTQRIIANAQAAQQSLYEVCVGLRDMRDGKLYKELGYQNFEDYCDNEVGINYRQAKKYVAIATGFEGSQLPSVGTEKLYLLAKLDEPTREAVTAAVDVEGTTVRELEAEIAKLRADKASKDKQFQAALASKQTEIDELRTGGKRRTDNLMTKIRQLQDELAAAKAAPQAAPQEIAVEDTSRIEALEQALAAAKADLADAQQMLAERPMVQEALPVAPIAVADSKAVFRAYLATAADSLRRLCEFLEQHAHDDALTLYLTKTDGILGLASDTVHKLKGGT